VALPAGWGRGGAADTSRLASSPIATTATTAPSRNSVTTTAEIATGTFQLGARR